MQTIVKNDLKKAATKIQKYGKHRKMILKRRDSAVRYTEALASKTISGGGGLVAHVLGAHGAPTKPSFIVFL